MSSTQSKLEKLQLALKSLGLYNGEIDGIVGPETLRGLSLVEALSSKKSSVDKPDADTTIQTEKVGQLIDGGGASIDDALAYTLKNEGGFSNHPADKGGATNRGITLERYEEYLGRKSTPEELKNIDYPTVKAIYNLYYWKVLNLDQILDQSIATALFDIGVLCGPGTSIRFAQEILGLPATKKADAATIKTLNNTTDEKFIPAFADRVIKYFNDIVNNKPSQHVFLKGWTRRGNRLRELVNDDSLSPTTFAVTLVEPVGNKLVELAKLSNMEKEMRQLIDFQKAHYPNSNPRYWAIFEIKKHSKEKRLHVFDRENNTVQHVHAAHGEGSDADNNGIADNFSNTPNSKQSSLGIYRTAETYNMAGHGRALRLDGLEGSNNKARERGIVFHGSKYVGEDYVKKNGRCGRSWGCPAVDDDLAQKLIDQLKGGSLLLITDNV